MLVFIFIILYFLFTNENVYYSKIENNNNNSLESNIYNYKTDNDKFIYNNNLEKNLKFIQNLNHNNLVNNKKYAIRNLKIP